ncbi:hypothetical protein ALI144C_35545 [Actinosynnema sp. ALI-1.44]|uniref:CHAT domain-containing protein n=1 Tax=Actinosynnema sp. ALI-1.44 TaxID=1933779 RepID=UPI00097C1175|nr:CHAT domain-containing protein [Actinosynnema sp. ALI-1.44]ONI76026.1 hypothetical protein ALI144C_35545 [Actinosynnema sp. ALI-1.44]
MEHWLSAVQTRLDRIAADRDFALALEPEALAEARQLTAALGSDRDREARFVLGWLHWYRYHALSPKGGKEDLRTCVTLFTPCFIDGVEGLPRPLRPLLADEAAPHAIDLLGREDLPGHLLVHTAELWQRIADASADHPDRPVILGYLTMAVKQRFEHSATAEDLDALIEAGRAAVRAVPADYPPEIRGAHLTDLAEALRARFTRTAAPQDLNEAIETVEAALAANPAAGVIRAGSLYELSWALRERFELAGAPADLDASVDACHAAVRITPVDHFLRAKVLASLDLTLQARFRLTGALADLDAAVAAGRAAVAATPADHPDRPAMLSGLGIPLRARFERTGAMADLEEAIQAFRQAVRASPTANALQLTNLGTALRVRFERAGAPADLDEAVQTGRAALRVARAADRVRVQAELAGTLRVRYGRTGVPADLDAVITFLTDALATAPADDLDRPRLLSGLGAALHSRFGRTAELSDVDGSVSAFADAVAATRPDHPDQASMLTNLGIALRDRFDHRAARDDRDAALVAFDRAARVRSAAPAERITAARAAAALAASTEPDRVADVLEIAVRLLPDLAPQRLRRSDQQYAIGQFSGLANDAAAVALSASGGSGDERAARALRLLEAGRAVLFSQALAARDDLRQRHPQLAARLAELRDQVDAATDPAAARAVDDRLHLIDELTATLTRIRSLPGFSGYGLLPSTEHLVAGAVAGPVVTLNVSRLRSDALLLTRDGITSVELPGLTLDAVVQRVNTFHQSLAGSADRTVETLEWLWDNVTGPVLGALGHSGRPADGAKWPRVWWAPGGLLGLLPLHAAGYHGDTSGERTVMDRVVSSYTPTVRALRHARERDSDVPAGSALIVAMPSTPGSKAT